MWASVWRSSAKRGGGACDISCAADCEPKDASIKLTIATAPEVVQK
jgi:hypothetical protein